MFDSLLEGSSGRADAETEQALQNMLKRRQCNPADMQLLAERFAAIEPPAIEVLRQPVFFEMCIKDLFAADSSVAAQDRKHYTFLLVGWGCFFFFLYLVCRGNVREGGEV